MFCQNYLQFNGQFWYFVLFCRSALLCRFNISQWKLTVDGVIWRFIFWAIIEELHCWTNVCRFFLASSHFSVCFYIWIKSCNKLDLLVNNGISLVLGKMRNCVMQNTDGKMRNEKMRNDGPHVRACDCNCNNYRFDLVAASDADTGFIAALLGFYLCVWYLLWFCVCL